MSSRPTILVVDDQPINVQLLKRKLEREGMNIIACHSGADALKQVAKMKPDLILLDVMMPDMDGIEVCMQLQENEDTRSIPVIFITARTSKEGKLEGLGVGAVDYITKPIDLDETLARIQTQLRFVAINREVIDLQRRLLEARQAATIGAVTQGIAHNLNNLLGVVIGYLDLIRAYHEKPELVLKNLEAVDDAIARIVSIIRQLSTLVSRSRPSLTKIAIPQLIENTLRRFRSEEQRDAVIQVENHCDGTIIETNTEIFEEALNKVLTNAWESYGDIPGVNRPIMVNIDPVERQDEGAFIRFQIVDRGPGVDREIRDRVFQPFISTKHTVGVGMGLTIARHSLRNLGGDIDLHDGPDGGTIVTIEHPVHRHAPR